MEEGHEYLTAILTLEGELKICLELSGLHGWSRDKRLIRQTQFKALTDRSVRGGIPWVVNLMRPFALRRLKPHWLSRPVYVEGVVGGQDTPRRAGPGWARPQI